MPTSHVTLSVCTNRFELRAGTKFCCQVANALLAELRASLAAVRSNPRIKVFATVSKLSLVPVTIHITHHPTLGGNVVSGPVLPRHTEVKYSSTIGDSAPALLLSFDPAFLRELRRRRDCDKYCEFLIGMLPFVVRLSHLFYFLHLNFWLEMLIHQALDLKSGTNCVSIKGDKDGTRDNFSIKHWQISWTLFRLIVAFRLSMFLCKQPFAIERRWWWHALTNRTNCTKLIMPN